MAEGNAPKKDDSLPEGITEVMLYRDSEGNIFERSWEAETHRNFAKLKRAYEQDSLLSSDFASVEWETLVEYIRQHKWIIQGILDNPSNKPIGRI